MLTYHTFPFFFSHYDEKPSGTLRNLLEKKKEGSSEGMFHIEAKFSQ